MGENQEIYNRGKEAFDSLMGYIDRFTDENDRKNGLLYYVKNSKVANLTVTKSVKKQNVLSYKAFLLNCVLRVHDGGGELNYKLYEDYYKLSESTEGREEKETEENNTKKKKYKPYRFNSMQLISYWGQEMNDAFFDATVKQAENVEYAEVMKQDRRYPYFFLTHLLKVTLNCLQEYFKLDMEKSAAMENAMDQQVRKRRGMYTKEELYARFVMAASLYELFAEEFLGDAMEKFSQQAKVVEENVKQLGMLPEVFLEGNQNGVKIPLEKLGQEGIEKLNRDMTLFYARTEWAKHYMDYRMYLDTFCAIIYLIEFHNVNRGDNAIQESVKCEELEVAFQDALSEISLNFLMNNEKQPMNVTAKKLYEGFMQKREKQRLFLELCGTSVSKKEKALKLIQKFMCKISESTNLADTELHKAVAEIAKNSLHELEE